MAGILLVALGVVCISKPAATLFTTAWLIGLGVISMGAAYLFALLGLSMLLLWKERSGWAGAALAIFYVLIFPGNINQYVEHINTFGLDTDQARLIRLFFQPVLIFLALWSTGGWATLKLWWSKCKGMFSKTK